MSNYQLIELVHLSGKTLLDIFRDAEKLYQSSTMDDEAIYSTLKDYYINERRENTK